ncbi:MAG: hypothetical protein OHK0028_19080 [Deltaproteobacteria bacterium]
MMTPTSMERLLAAALRYAELGYPVFPCAPGGKVPLTPRGFKDATTDPAQIAAWWEKHPEANIGIPTAGLLVVDVDGEDNTWPGDPERVEDLACGLISLTPRGGRHYIFRQPQDRTFRNTTGRIAPNVDTRADGGYIVVPPSVVGGKMYRWAETFELNVAAEELPEPPAWLVDLLDRPGDLFSRGDAGDAGDGRIPPADAPGSPQGVDLPPDGNPIPAGTRNATLARLAGTMRRVGMTRDEILAALKRMNEDRCRPPLPGREVERIAASICRYEPDQVSVAVVEDHWGQDQQIEPDSEHALPALPDPGLLPGELLRIPGFVSEVMDHCMAIAPYPNQVMAFCGALALMAVLAGRKVCDDGNNRTNLYLLGLAHSASGKDQPRKLNVEILHAVGMVNQVAGRFASGEGVQDALYAEPCMLFQTDEIDGLLQSVNKAKDARHESIMETLLTIYSSANTVFAMRRKAGKESMGSIDQPHLVILGTAIPNHYYQALSERMLTNGFFARMIILECGRRPPGQKPKILPLPGRVLETAKWWAQFRPGTGNLQDWHPVPRVVPCTDEADQIMDEVRKEAEAEYERAESSGDAVSTTVWGRVDEHARKLALLYAVSEDHKGPRIGRAAALWARRFIIHATRRMLFMAQEFVADNPFHAECLKLVKKLREAPGNELPHSALLKRMNMDAKSFLSLVETLQQQGDIVVRTQPAPGCGRPSRFYRLNRG